MFLSLNFSDVDEEDWSLTLVVLLGVAMVTLGTYKYHWFGFFRPRQQTANEPAPQDAIEMPPLSPEACATILNVAQFLDPYNSSHDQITNA